MMNGDWGSGGAWMILGGLMMVAFWALVFWAIVSRRRPTDTTPRTRPAEEILDERFARGELDADEYQQRRHALQAS